MVLRGQILNIEAFRELCRRSALEKDPAKLEEIQEEMRVMLGAADIQVCQIRWKPAQKPN